MAKLPITFFAGADDYRVDRLARAWFEEKSQNIDDEFSKEILDASVSNLSELETLLGQVRSAVQTLSLFGDRKVVWVRGCNFMADSGVGKTTGARELWEAWEELLLSLEKAEIEIAFSASPIDRRKQFFKFFNKHTHCTFIATGGKGEEEENARFIRSEAQRLDVRIEDSAIAMLLEKIPESSRLWVSELEKLAAYLGTPQETITGDIVRDQVSVFGEGSFFEAAEAFFSLDLKWTLEALDRHFFHSNQPRPLIASLLNRGRLMIQLAALTEGGLIPKHARISESILQKALQTMNPLLADLKSKTGFSIFTQNPWYLDKLLKSAVRLKLRSWIQIQIEITHAFEQTIQRPEEPLEIMRELAIRCLTQKEIS